MKTLLHNGKFFIESHQWAEALCINEYGKIDALYYSENEIPTELWESCSVIDMAEQWILPGFEDAHNHPVGHARALVECDFRDTEITWPEAKRRIQEYAQTVLPNEWIVVHGWNETQWPEMTIDELDSISSSHPIIVANIAYHVGMVNTRGAKEFSLPQAGILEEEQFENVFDTTAPEISKYANAVIQMQHKLISLGITAVHDMEIRTIHQLAVCKYIDEHGMSLIPMELYVTPDVLYDESFKSYVKYSWQSLRILGLKLPLDGAFGGSTAAVSIPYPDTGGTGVLRYTEKECLHAIAQAAQYGLTHVALHCIGDRACNFAADIMNDWNTSHTEQNITWRFEHYELPSDHSLALLAENGGIASMQPNFSWDAANYAHRLGDRISKLNPFPEIISRNIPLVFGSDDMPSGPLEGIAWATENAPFPEQQVSIEQAFAAYTSEPARIIGKSDERGVLKKNHYANLCVYDNNPFENTANSLQIQAVWVAGKKYSE